MFQKYDKWWKEKEKEFQLVSGKCSVVSGRCHKVSNDVGIVSDDVVNVWGCNGKLLDGVWKESHGVKKVENVIRKVLVLVLN